MRSTTRWVIGGFLLLGLALALPACDDSEGVPCDCEPSIVFTSPTGGALTEFHDLAAEELGIQAVVRLQTRCIPDGTRLSYSNSQSPGEQVEGVVVLDDAASGEGHVDLGLQTFLEGNNRVCAAGSAEVTWPADGEGACTARIVDPVEGCKDVLVQLGVPACRFDVPQDGSTLGAADDASGAPGFQHDVVLACKGIDDGTSVALRLGDGLPLEGVLGQASVTFSAVGFGEGLNLLRAETTDPDGEPVSAEISVIVDTGGCAVRLLPPDGTVLRAVDDLEPGTEGLQTRMRVETDADGAFACPDGAAVTLDVAGEQLAGVLASGQAEFTVTLVDGTHEAFATVTAGSGVSGRSLTQVYRVCATGVAIVLEAPAEGVTLTDTADRDPAAMGIQVAVRGTAQGVVSAEDLWVELDGVVVESGGAPLQPVLFEPDGAFEFRYLDLLQSRTYAVQVKGRSACDDEGMSAVSQVPVLTEQLTCQIVAPADGAVLVLADDKNADPTDGLQLDVQVVTANVPDGFTFDLHVGGQETLTGLAIQGGGWTGEVTLEDGVDKALWCELQTQQVSPMVVVTVDTVPPTVEITSPVDGAVFDQAAVNVAGVSTDAIGQLVTITVGDGTQSDSVVGTVAGDGSFSVPVSLFTGVNTVSAALTDEHGNPASDQIMVSAYPCAGGPVIAFLDPPAGPEPVLVADAGPYDVQVQVTDFLPANGAIVLRVVQGAAIDEYSSPGWSGDVATFAAVSLPNGQVTLEVEASNSCASTLQPLLLFVGPANAPSATITTPGDTCGEQTLFTVGVLTTNATGDCMICVRATDPSALPVCDASQGGQAAAIQADGTCSLDVDLGGEGDYQIWASVTGELAQVASSLPVQVIVDLTAPTVEITSPAADTTLDASTPDMSPGTAGFQFQLAVTADVPDGTPVTVAGVDAVIGSPTFTGGVAYPMVTLADGAHAITAEACDCAAHCTTSPARNVLVDRQAPSVTVTQPVNGAVLGLLEDASAAQGFQLNVRCQLANASVGDTLTLSSNVDSAGFTVEGTRVLLAGDVGGYTFSAVDLLADGVTLAGVELRCDISDPAGNADSDQIAVTVNLNAPQVSVTRPLPNAQLNIFSDMCPPAGLQTQVDIATQGTTVGDDLRLCLCAGTCTPDAGSPDECTQLGYGVTAWDGQVSGPTTVVSCVAFPEGAVTLRAFAAPAGLPLQGTYSNPVPVTVDSLPPSVDVLTVTADGNGDSCLNLAEGVVTVEAVISDQGEGVEGRDAILYRAWPPGTEVDRTQVSGGVAVFSSPVALVDGDYSFTVVVTDLFNNPNVRATNPVIDDPEAWALLELDTVAPTLQLTSPSKSTLLKADDTLDPLTDDLELSLVVSTDAEDGQVVSFGPMGGVTGLVSGGQASSLVSLGQGSVTLTADVSDDCANPAVQASRPVLVDTLVPTIACSQPLPDATFAQQQVPFVCATTGTDATQSITVVSTTGGQRCQVAVDASGTTSFDCNLAVGSGQTLTVSTTDPAGNPAADTILNVSVETGGCDIAIQGLSSPERWNLGDDLDGNAANGLQQDVTACSSNCTGLTCPGCRMRLLIEGVQFGALVAPDASGCATWSGITLADGATAVDLQAEIENPPNPTGTDVVTIAIVDLVPPTLARVRPGADSVTCVANAGNQNLDNPYVAAPANVVRDKVAGVPCDMDFELTVDDDKLSAAFPATLVVERGGAPFLGPSQVDAGPQSVVYANAQLAHDQVHALVARVTDYAGNEATPINLGITADVLAPDVIAASADLGADPAATRHADVVVNWVAVGDDGAAGTPASYRVRWSRAAIGDEDRWFYTGTTWPNQVYEVQNGAAVGASLVLPPLNDYHVAVRAVDEVGNQSPIHADVVVQNNWDEVAYQGSATANFGYTLRNVGDVNGDGRDDLLVGAPTYSTNVGAAWLFLGADDLSTWSLAGTPIPLLHGTAGESFGYFVQRIGDIDGDGLDDVAVGGNGFQSYRGRLSIYFGRADIATNQPTGPDLELRGPSATTGRFGFSYAAIGDVNGDGYSDLFVSANRLDANGRGYIFYGRPRSEVDPAHPDLYYWFDDTNVRTGLESGVHFVPAAEAEIDFLGIDLDDRLGSRFGNTSLGDIDGDGYGDVAISASRVNETYTFDGANITSILGDVSPGNTSHRVDLITYGTVIDNGGFGQFAIGGLDVTGDGILDLLVSNAYNNRVYLFSGRPVAGDPAVAINPVYTRQLSWAEAIAFGVVFDAGDLNLDGWPDLQVGCNASTGNRAFVFLNNRSGAGGTPYFDNLPSSVLAGAAGSYYGVDLSTGDFNGDALPDMAIGASSLGRIFVRH